MSCFLTQHLYFLKPGDSTPRPSVNPLYSKSKILNLRITLNYQTFYLHMIASKVIYQHFVIVLQHIPILQKSRSKSGKYSYCKNKKPLSQIILNPNLLIFGSFCKSLLTGYFTTGYV